jgi:hypothetical protein
MNLYYIQNFMKYRIFINQNFNEDFREKFILSKFFVKLCFLATFCSFYFYTLNILCWRFRISFKILRNTNRREKISWSLYKNIIFMIWKNFTNTKLSLKKLFVRLVHYEHGSWSGSALRFSAVSRSATSRIRNSELLLTKVNVNISDLV